MRLIVSRHWFRRTARHAQKIWQELHPEWDIRVERSYRGRSRWGVYRYPKAED